MRLSLMVQAHRLRYCLFLPGSEVRLQGCGSGEIGCQRFDVVWLRRVNLENDRIARWYTLVRRRTIGDRGQQPLQIDTFQRNEGVVEAIARDVVICHRLLQNGIGDLRLSIAELEVAIRFLFRRILLDILQHLRHTRNAGITPGSSLGHHPEAGEQWLQGGDSEQSPFPPRTPENTNWG